MANCDSMKVSAVAIDKQQEDDIYETETDIALEDPSISIKVSRIPCDVHNLIYDLYSPSQFDTEILIPYTQMQLLVDGWDSWAFSLVLLGNWEYVLS